MRKEQEVGKELKALYDGRLLTEREYHNASRMQQQETARQRLKAETDALAAPRLNIAGDVDPAVRLNNQLVQQQAQYQAYYQQGILDKQRYEQLMQAATQESSDAQYQQALSLFGGQSRVHKMALGLVDMTRERTSGMMFDLLTGTQNFKQSMLGLMTSMTQSIIQQLIDLAMQALLTRTFLSTFMNIGGGLLGGAASAGAGTAGSGAMGMPTGWQGYVPNAKGGVYASPSLSAFSGQIVSNPTLFAFARGAGLMGEAGPGPSCRSNAARTVRLACGRSAAASSLRRHRMSTSPSRTAATSARRPIRDGASSVNRWAISPRRKARR